MQGHELHAPTPGTGAFLRELVHQLRLHADDAAWDGKDDAELVAPLLGSSAGDEELDAERYFLVELFHVAVANVVARRSGVPCSVMMRMHADGSGRVALLAGRLVVVNRELRDARRFAFASVERLAEAGERLAEAGVEMIARFPSVASYDG